MSLAPKFSIILAGGKGTRMRSADRHKVCFPIEGEPAVNRTVGMLEDAGVGKIVVVVGALADEVISTVGSRFPKVVFAYQNKQLGTGNAALIGTQALERLGHAGPILVTMGDKVIEPAVISGLCEQFVRAGLPGRELLALIPFSDAIRRADRAGSSVLEGLGGDALMRFEEILRALEAESAS